VLKRGGEEGGLRLAFPLLFRFLVEVLALDGVELSRHVRLHQVLGLVRKVVVHLRVREDLLLPLLLEVSRALVLLIGFQLLHE